jgi:hypothetical protein
MDGNMKVGIQLGATDNATPVVKSMRNELDKLATARSNLGVRSEHAIQREIQRTQASYNRLARSGSASSEELSRAYGEMRKNISALRAEMASEAEATRSNLERMSTARSMLGIRSEKEIQREIQRTEAAYNRLARSGKLSSAEQSRAFTEMKKRVAALNAEMEHEAEQTRSTYQRMATARAMIGIRSEKEIQREIQQTEASYNRLAAAGFASAEEQERALMATKDKVAALRKELQGATKDSRGFGSKMMSIAGAVWGAKQVMGPVFDRQLNYDERLTYAANRIYSDRDVQGRLEGKKELNNIIEESVRHGNGSPDDVLEGMATMVTSGAFKLKDVRALLPTLTAYATSSGNSPALLAQLAASLKRTGISNEEMPNALSTVVRASQMGRMDLATMAHDMPKQMEGARNLGLSGREALQWVLTANETASITAGTEEEAATNVTDLFAGLMSSHTINNAKRIKVNGKGVDWVGSMRAAVAKGVSPIDAAMQIFRGIVNSDKGYRTLQQKLKTEKDPVKRKRLEAESTMIEGKYLAQLWPNQQERNAVISLYHYQPDAQRIYKGTQEEMDAKPGHLAGDVDLETLNATPAFQIRQAAHEKELEENDMVAPVNKALGAVATEATKVAEEFPGLAHAATFAADAVQAFGYALLASSALNLLQGGAAAGAGKRVLKTVAGSAAKFTPELLKRGGPVIAAGVGAYDAYEVSKDPNLTDKQKGQEYTKIAGGAAGAWAGAEGGAVAGSMVVPGIGTAVGAALGSIAGYFAGDYLGEKLGKNVYSDDKSNPMMDHILPEAAPPVVNNEIHVYLDGQEIHSALEDRTNQSALRN